MENQEQMTPSVVAETITTEIDNVINELEKEVKFSEIYLSFGPSLTDIKQYR